MPLLRLNATPQGLAGHARNGSAASLIGQVSDCVGPAIIMVHGYKYAPHSANHCPHKKIFAKSSNSWPGRLGFGSGRTDDGIGIGLGWYARGPLTQAHSKAGELGRDIAMIVALLRARQPLRPVHIVAHSLGSEAALAALPHLRRGAISRLVLLTGASYAKKAQERLNTPAGQSAKVLNVTSRENDVFDAVFERLIPSERTDDHAIGMGIDAPNVANIQLDCASTLAGLQVLGHSIARPQKRICHWSAYRREGVMEFYASFLRRPDSLPLDAIKNLVPERAAPRWSRLVNFTQKPSTSNMTLPLGLSRLVSDRRIMSHLFRGKLENEPSY